MSKVDTYACNVCQVQKKEANHWMHGHLIGTGVAIFPWGMATVPEDPGMIALTIDNADAHLCGLEHALQWAGKELSSK